jgi:hypothetical protein
MPDDMGGTGTGGLAIPGGGWDRAALSRYPRAPRVASFTEPNLGFTLEERTAGRVRIRAEFTGEGKPPWFQRGPEQASNSYLVCLDLSAEGVAQAARSWMHGLAEFPGR